MKISKRSIGSATAVLLALVTGGVTATVAAQGGQPADKKVQHPAQAKDSMKMQHPAQKKDAKEMSGMSQMMGDPHHVLAMAYRDNLATFARALRTQVNRSKSVNLDLARPAVAEMRRSYDQIRQHHQAQTAMMGTQPAAATTAMQHMDTHLAALNDHLGALEAEVNGAAPDPAKVTDHLNGIVKECGGMSAMPAKGKPE
jgi:hypothetical protein